MNLRLFYLVHLSISIFVLILKIAYVFLIFKGAAKLYFMHYLSVVIILFITDLYKSAFSTSFLQIFYSIFVIIIYIETKCSVILFSPKVIMKKTIHL